MTMYRHNAEACRDTIQAQRSWHLCMALPLGRILAIQEGKMVHAAGTVFAVRPITCLALLVTARASIPQMSTFSTQVSRERVMAISCTCAGQDACAPSGWR